MKIEFSQSIDFNQMLVFSVFGHLVILTIVLFFPKPSVQVKTIVPAFMVNLVEIPSGQKQAAPRKTVRNRKTSVKKTKPQVKKTNIKKKVAKKKIISKKSLPKPNKILKALKRLDKNAVAVETPPTKKMIEELDQLALLERHKKNFTKPKKKKPVLKETFRELEKLKNKKIDLKNKKTPKVVSENLLEDFEELKMEEVVEQKELAIQPESIEEKVSEKKEPVIEKRNLLKELEKLAKLESVIKVDEKQLIEENIDGKAFDSVLEKFESLKVESSRVKVEVTKTEFEESKFQSKLRALSDSPEKTDPRKDDGSHVFSDLQGTPQANIQSLYARLVQKKIYKNWRDPLAERHSKEAIISFHIYPQGNIDKPFIKQSSGVEILDALAVRAVNDSVPFPVFPKELKKSNLFLDIHFKYVPKDN
tara:strand:+ start:204 stop:1460 length:1257 start_codon:yes stop_codon:yes gene_type:complete